MNRITVWVVRTPKGDRPYVSTHKPQSYIDHLTASGEQAEVYEAQIALPWHSVPLMGMDDNEFVSLVQRVH